MRALLICALAAGCGGAITHRAPDEQTGCGKDESWHSFDDNEPTAVVDDSQAPQITQPSLTGTVPFSPKPVFQWNQDAASPGMPPAGDVPYLDGPGCMGCCPQFNTGALTSLHLPAISGDVYDLQFSVGGSQVHRVITTLQEWTAPDLVWNQWRGQTVTLELYRMQVLADLPKAGPFVGTAPFVIRIGS